jgi:transcriptional repressor NrdR
MRCPHCSATENRVVDSRVSKGGSAVRRRRECTSCGARFTTYEYVEERPITVVKRDGRSEEFDRAKLVRSLRVACAKRPIGLTEIDELADRTQEALARDGGGEVPSARIGELVMTALEPLDRVAYVRFASVYRNFQDIDEFEDVVKDLNTLDQREAMARHQAELPLPEDDEVHGDHDDDARPATPSGARTSGDG